MQNDSSANVADWVEVLLFSLDEKYLRSIWLGGSAGDAVVRPLADTDLFVVVADGYAFEAAGHLRETLRQSSTRLVSTFSFRQDFGLRLRVASSPTSSCSFFFLEEHMLRNTAHQRRGHVVWRSSNTCGPMRSNLDAPADGLARIEELTDSLLEVPSALKYLNRADYCAAAIRLTRVVVGLVNHLTLDQNDYVAGTDKHLAARMRQLVRGFESDHVEASSRDKPPYHKVAMVIGLLRMVDLSGIATSAAGAYAAFIDESVQRLSAYEPTINRPRDD